MLRGWELEERPIREYGAEIWGESGRKEKDTNGNEKEGIGVSEKTTNEVVQGELGWRVKRRRTLLSLRFWSKIINMNKDRLICRYIKREERNL
jgi:hypothetical protein